MIHMRQRSRLTRAVTLGLGALATGALVATSGLFVTAASANLAARDSNDVELVGDKVTGATQVDEAPELTAGSYIDKTPTSEMIYYRVKRTTKGSTIHAGVFGELDEESNSFGSMSVTTFVRDEDDSTDGLASCNSRNIYDQALDNETKHYAYGGTSSWYADPEVNCVTADEVIVGVTNDGDAGGAPMQVSIYEEPPLEDPSGRGLDAAPPAPTWDELEVGDAKSGETAGNSFANAPVLDDGTYEFDINSDETQLVAIGLDWGTSLQAQLEAKVNDELINSVGDSGQIGVDVINPVLGSPQVDLDSVPAGWVNGGALSTARATGTFRTGALTYTTNYLNRATDTTSGAALPGRHYVRIRFAGEDAGASNVKYILTLKRNGDAGQGAPEYAEGGEAKAPGTDTGVESGSSFPFLSIALILVGLAALAAAAVFVLRSRNRPSNI